MFITKSSFKIVFRVIAGALIVLFLLTAQYLYQVAAPTPTKPDDSILHLNQYSIIQQYTIDTVVDNLSGITYTPQDTLLAVIDTPSQLIELDLNGNVLRNIELVNFHDTEGIAHIEGDTYAIIQEEHCSVTYIQLFDTSTSLDARNYNEFVVRSGPQKDDCLEGIGWSKTAGLFLANEKLPNRIIHLPPPLFTGLGNTNKYTDDVMPRFFNDLPLKDISGMHVDEKSQRLLVVSDESRMVVELDFSGNIQSEYRLYSDLFGQDHFIEQPEGVTMDSHGQIYVVGEPNILLVLGLNQAYIPR